MLEQGLIVSCQARPDNPLHDPQAIKLATELPTELPVIGALDVPVVGEGRFDDPQQVAEAFARGAHAVVVGTAVTNPREITRRFVRGVPPR